MRKALGWVVLMGLMAAPSVFSDELKIGVVDMQKALQSVDAGRKAKSQLETQVSARQKEFKTEEAAIRKMTDEFKKQSLVMSDEARAKKQAEIQDRVMKFQESYQRSQMEFQQKEHELTQPIIDKLKEIVTETAKKRGFNFVLEKNDNTVLFSQDKDDLTSEVISAYNKLKS